MTQEISKPESDTWFISYDTDNYHCGCVSPNQVMTTSRENIETFSTEVLMQTRLGVLGITYLTDAEEDAARDAAAGL